MSVPSRERLNDYCAKGLLRRLRNQSIPSSFSRPRVDRLDAEELKLRWALSSWIGQLAEHILKHPREARSSIDFIDARTQGEISGIVDARATLIEQALSCDPSIFIVQEPSASLINGPNHLVAWILNEAEEAVLATIRRLGKTYDLEWLHDRARLLDEALRNQMLREVMLSPVGRVRPGLAARRSAARSRAQMYRLALEAFEALENIEGLNEETLRHLMLDTLIAPLDNWQMLELSAALAAAEALSKVMDINLHLRLSLTGERVVANIGGLEVHWQRSLSQRPESLLDPSEILAKDLAESIGVGIGSSRVDVSIIDARSDKELAHIECKWFENEKSASGAISDAVLQITRYARDSRPTSLQEVREMLRDSIIVVASKSKYAEKMDSVSPIAFTDFEGLEAGRLETWARAFASRHGFVPASPSPTL